MSRDPRSLYYLAMAIMTQLHSVCDVCRNPRRKVKTYRVQNGEAGWVLTLCREDGRTLVALLQHGTEVPATKKPGPPVKLWDLDEIEAAKKKQ